MILTCPACGTQYVVKDGAVPPQGRQVRCASCKHSWHQNPDPTDGEEVVARAPAEAARIEPAAAQSAYTDPVVVVADEPSRAPEPDDESFAAAALIEPRSGPEVEELAYEAAMIDGADENAPTALHEPANATVDAETEAADSGSYVEPQAASDERWSEADFSPFADHGAIDLPRRGRLLPLLLSALLIAALAAAFWFLAPPEWKARVGLADGSDTPLQLLMTHSDRQKLASGNELLAITGRVINPTAKAQSVPAIQAELRSRSGKLVYSWTIQPPAPSLAPGASATFNDAQINVPAGGDELTVSLGAPKA